MLVNIKMCCTPILNADKMQRYLRRCVEQAGLIACARAFESTSVISVSEVIVTQFICKLHVMLKKIRIVYIKRCS